MGIQSMVFCLVLGCLISLLIVPLTLLPGLMHSAQPRIGKRKGPRAAGAPRYGGVALAPAFLGVAVLAGLLRPDSLRGPEVIQLHLIWAALIMTCLGAWNDYRQPGTWRLLGLQAAVAAGLFFQGIHIESFDSVAASAWSVEGLCSFFVTVFWLVSLTNLPRIMDKVTGLAASTGCLALALVALAGYWSEAGFPALWAIGMAGALVGFLIYNLRPCRVRLGGAGSSLIGFLIGSLTILSAERGSVLGSSITPFLVVMLLILGAGFAVMRRDLGGLALFPLGRKASPRGTNLPHSDVNPHAS